MSAAVRGDFARLRARGVATTIVDGGRQPDAAPAAPDGEPAPEVSEPRSFLGLRRRRR